MPASNESVMGVIQERPSHPAATVRSSHHQKVKLDLWANPTKHREPKASSGSKGGESLPVLESFRQSARAVATEASRRGQRSRPAHILFSQPPELEGAHRLPTLRMSRGLGQAGISGRGRERKGGA